MPFTSGHPKIGGRAKGKANRATEAVRRLVNDNAADIVRLVIEQAKAGDVHAQATFIRMLPKYRFVAQAVDMPAPQSAAEAMENIGMLCAMTARGDLDLGSLEVLSRTLSRAVDVRLSEIEDILEQRESEDAG